MEWYRSLVQSTNRKQHRAEIRELVNDNSYGQDTANGQWTVTQLVRVAPEAERLAAMKLLTGENERGELTYGTGSSIVARLKVLSRQGCCRDRSGEKLGPYASAKDDKPKTGDVVEVKDQRRESEYHDSPASDEFDSWQIEGKRRHHYREFVVDSDGCIAVPFIYAVRMLSANGFRIAKPEFRKEEPTKREIDMALATGGKEPARVRFITNWHFEEVFEMPKKRTAKKPVEKVDKAEPTV